MHISHPRSALLRALLVLAVSGLLGLSLTAPPSAGAHSLTRDPATATAAPTRPGNVLDTVGARYVGAQIPIKGYTWGAPGGRHKLALQRYSKPRHRWVTRSTQRVRNGGYAFPAQHRSTPGWARFRTVLHLPGRLVVSNKIRVQVVPVPPAAPAPAPAPAPVPPPAAATCAQDPSQATCIKPVATQPAGAMLPDLRIKDLTRCGAGDMQRTGGTCFMIDPSAAYDASFPGLAGHKLLKFPVITLNMGSGPGEIVANRSSDTSTDWVGYQNFYDANGHLLGSMLDPTVQFYFAGDGHNHWHVRDFDEYDLLQADGTTIAHAEKHGYCMQDNTSWDPWQGLPGVSPVPVYEESTSCGKGLTGATSIVHGLSKGWGDTYPTTLPDQAIDITGVPDGTYTVRVHADAVGAVRESNEDNNTAQVQIQITGDTVQVVPGSSQGGM